LKEITARDKSKYVAYGGSAKLFQSVAPEVLFEGPANCGKTRGLLEKCYLMLTEFPGLRMLWIRKTRASLTESVLVTWEEHVLPEGHHCMHGRASRENRKSYKFRNGSVVVLGGMDKSRKVMSTEYDVICYFEATDGDLRDWLRLITRARNKRILLGRDSETKRPVYFHQLIADVNPASEYHWLNQRALEGHMERIKATHADNPLFDDDDQRRLDSLTGATRRRLRDGEWCSEDGQVWPCWDRETMMCMREDLLIDRQRPHGGYKCEWYFGSLDFGMRHAQVFQIWGVLGSTIYRVAEIYKRQKSEKWWGDKIAWQMQKWPLHTIVADGGGLGIKLIDNLNDRLGARGGNKQLGIVRPALKGAGSRLHGFKQVYAKMEQGQIILCHDALEEGSCEISLENLQPTCTEQEIPSLTWARAKEGGAVPKDDSDSSCVDDGCFAMIYAVDWFWGRESSDRPPQDPVLPPGSIGDLVGHDRWLAEVRRKERYG